MPTYFFLSGMLFSDRRHDTLKKYVISKSKSLLLPYVSLSVFFTLCDYELFRHPAETILRNLDWIFIQGNGAPKAYALWFVLTLYLASIAYYIINKYVKKIGYKLLTALAISTAGYLLMHCQINTPLKIGTLCAAVVFLTAGHLAAKLKNISFDWSVQLVSIIFVLFGITILCSYDCIHTDRIAYLGMNKLPPYWIFYPGALCGTMATVLFFNLLGRYDSVLFRVLKYIARNALIILASHGYALLVLTHLVRVFITDNPTMNFLLVTMLLIPTEVAIICFFNRYFYRMLGKPRQELLQSLSLNT